MFWSNPWSNPKKPVTWVTCVDSQGYPDLKVGTAYQVVPDELAAGIGFRIVDESGKENVYPADRFKPGRFRARPTQAGVWLPCTARPGILLFDVYAQQSARFPALANRRQ
jgi:hypothetical protein